MKDFKEKVKELRIIKLQETFYLGIIKDDVLIDAIDCGKSFVKGDITRWFCCYNLGDVYEEMKLVGSAGYTIRPFDIDEARYAEQCLLMMGDSKKLALQQVENDYFKKAMNNNEEKKKGDEDEEDD